MSSFVSLGNATQMFPRLLAAVAAAQALLPRPLIVQHGATSPEALAMLPETNLHGFMPMAAFEAEVAAAQLLILHAGAGSVLHAVRAGKTPILMPRRAHLGEHVDDHQLEFARTLAASGHVILAETADDLPPAIARALAALAPARVSEAQSPMLRLISEKLGQLAARTDQRSGPRS